MAGSSAKEPTYKIGDVCKLAEVQPYVLRYWETEFAPLAPAKSGGGQRVYTQREVDLILRIKQLLYSEGFTISGAKKKLEAELNAPPPAKPMAIADAAAAPASDGRAEEKLESVKRELRELLALLRR